MLIKIVALDKIPAAGGSRKQPITIILNVLLNDIKLVAYEKNVPTFDTFG